LIDPALPVAMFDSGVGGLTVLHECLVALPQEDYVYLGDTSMFPYGSRDPAALRERIAAITESLLRRGVKLVVIACNTATAIGEDVVREVAAGHGVDVVSVVAPQAEIAAAITDNGRVGVLATTNTVESGAYRRALQDQGRALDVIEVAAPRLAPFIQEGLLFDAETMEMARGYCAPLREAGVDTLILGCTHYPLLTGAISYVMGDDVTLVSSAEECAKDVYKMLTATGLMRPGGEPTYTFATTGATEEFETIGRRFLGAEMMAASQFAGGLT